MKDVKKQRKLSTQYMETLSQQFFGNSKNKKFIFEKYIQKNKNRGNSRYPVRNNISEKTREQIFNILKEKLSSTQNFIHNKVSFKNNYRLDNFSVI